MPFENKIYFPEEKRDSGSPVGENGFSDEIQAPADIGNETNGVDDDDDWEPEPLTEAEKLSAQVGKLIVDKDLDKSVEERLDMLHQYFIQAKKDGTIYVNIWVFSFINFEARFKM